MDVIYDSLGSNLSPPLNQAAVACAVLGHLRVWLVYGINILLDIYRIYGQSAPKKCVTV